MSNADPEPWAPDPATAPGKPPQLGSVGERGTSQFAGNSNYNADTTPTTPNDPARGPAVGTAYYANEFPTAIASGAGTTSVRSSAGT